MAFTANYTGSFHQVWNDETISTHSSLCLTPLSFRYGYIMMASLKE